jgi:hypothetical protein
MLAVPLFQQRREFPQGSDLIFFIDQGNAAANIYACFK